MGQEGGGMQVEKALVSGAGGTRAFPALLHSPRVTAPVNEWSQGALFKGSRTGTYLFIRYLASYQVKTLSQNQCAVRGAED